MPFQQRMGAAPMVLKRAAILLHLVLFLFTSAAEYERQAGIVGRQRRQVLLQERATLLAFKRGLTLLSPSALADWNESSDVCGFTGVTCDWRREHVVGLALGNMSIHAAIPPVVGSLSHLRNLTMSDNHITGAIPPSVGNLTRLQYLDLSNNLISGEIPPLVGNLSHLQNFTMSHNNITGAIPPSVGNLTLLQYLDLSNNHISGDIPPSFGNLSCLFYLDMSNNLLTGQIPADLSNHRNLEALDLGQNQLSGGIPPSLAELPSLFYISLGHNYLSGLIPAAIFQNCTWLGVVALGDNHLSGKIPRDASHNFANTFAALDLHSNRLSGTLPRWLANCTYLLILDVENNSLADELPTGIIEGKQHLQYLHLSNNRFWSHDGNTNLEPFFTAVSSCPQILHIEVGGTGIGGRLP